MKIMKKFAALFALLFVLLALSVPALAANSEDASSPDAAAQEVLSEADVTSNKAMAAGVTTMVEGTSTLVPPVADKGRYLTYAELYGIDAPAWPDRRTVAPRTPRDRHGLARVRGAIGRTGGRRRGKGRRGGRK